MYVTLLLSVAIVLICVLLLGIRIFFTKGGRFPDTHVGHNKAMKERGIKCAQTQDYQERKKKNFLDLIDSK
ncbi:hypothetical protein LJB98_04370 [Bacteroidales bacterium OttesenSCG-928-M11]|nr:hypothetical protein [Bacteroidales bacterium OttesenSCG-928-M11]